MTLVAWRLRPDTFEAMLRCTDHDACRSRVIAKGEAWEVADGQPHGRIIVEPADPPAQLAEGEAQW